MSESERVLGNLRQAYARLGLAMAALGHSGEAGRQLKAAQELVSGVAAAVQRKAAGDPDLTCAVLAAFPGSRVTGSVPRTPLADMAAINEKAQA